MKPRIPIEMGKEYGWLTVLGIGQRDAACHFRYKVRCRCGKEYDVQPSFLKKKNPKCVDCSRKYDNHSVNRIHCVGETIGTWKVIAEVGKNNRNEYLYKCQCLLCGSISKKTQSAIRVSNGKGCQHCIPNYHFIINGKIAIGTLLDGTEFVIDAEDVDLVSAHYWHHKKSKGYIISKPHQSEKLFLHRFLIGVSEKNVIVDHINRNKLDCRKGNLRLVTAQQNSMNASLPSTNTSGFMGVSFVTRRKCYRAQIGLGNKDIYLGSSKDSLICAQMYNYAALLLFKDYVGHLNDVPELDDGLKRKIEERCHSYMAESLKATQPCGHFLCAAKGA